MNNADDKNDALTLELLDAIEQRSDQSQRDLAAKLGIALGLTNSYLRRCAKKGYVKVKEVPANRYLYYLTPKGFKEKSRLTARFLSTSLTFYRQAAESCSALYEFCEGQGWRRIVLCGASDLAEIALARSAVYDVNVVHLYDPNWGRRQFAALPARRAWGDVARVDAYLITGLDDPLAIYNDLTGRVSSPEQILVPSVLRLDGAIRHSK